MTGLLHWVQGDPLVWKTPEMSENLTAVRELSGNWAKSPENVASEKPCQGKLFTANLTFGSVPAFISIVCARL